MDEPKKHTINQAHTLLKQGKKVTLSNDPEDYYFIQDSNGTPTVFHKKPNGELRIEQVRPPAPTEAWDKKNFELVDDRIAYNAYLAENPPEGEVID